MNVLLTGGTGYLGSYLVSALLKKGDSVRLLSRRPHPLFQGAPGFHETLGDLSDIGVDLDQLKSLKPDVVINTAAMTSPKECEERPAEAARINAQLPEMLAKMARGWGAFMCSISTDLVFDGGDCPKGGFKESDRPYPSSVYAKTKHDGEAAVLDCCDRGRAAVIRTAIFYGPAIGERSSSLKWMEEAISQGRPVTLFEDEWRTPVFIGDVVECVLATVSKRIGGIFHCGGPDRVSRLELGSEYAKCFGFSKEVIVKSKRHEVVSVPPRPRDVSLNSNFTADRLGVGYRSLKDGLRQMRLIPVANPGGST